MSQTLPHSMQGSVREEVTSPCHARLMGIGAASVRSKVEFFVGEGQRRVPPRRCEASAQSEQNKVGSALTAKPLSDDVLRQDAAGGNGPWIATS
jgi:hypothetical protein